jgi:hypothetical protein
MKTSVVSAFRTELAVTSVLVSVMSIGCAGNERQTENRKRVSYQSSSYHNKVENKYTQIPWFPAGKPPNFVDP